MHRKSASLSKTAEGERAVIISFHLNEDMRERLYSLGMIPGTVVKCLYRREGGLAAYSVRGTVIAIRLSDADRILVE